MEMSDQFPTIAHNLYFIEPARAEDAHTFIRDQFDENALLVEHDQEQWPSFCRALVTFWTITELEIFTRMDIVATTHANEWSFNELEDGEE
jgi:hypothetical protein